MKSVLRISLFLWPVLFLSPGQRVTASGALAHLPRTTLWAWQMPEYLNFINPRDVAVAYLDQTVYVQQRVRSEPRTQPMQVPTGTHVIAVVRIEMPPGSPQSEEIKTELTKALLRSARRPGITALQLDFDAVNSQRDFYRDILTGLRRQMPGGMPLSITALASWCAFDDWIADLPIDEAVPMMFRLGRNARLFEWQEPAKLLNEPLCSGSVGVSTDEPWPGERRGKRVYVFHPQPWTTESVNKVLEQVER